MRETCQNMTALQDWFNIAELPVRRFIASLPPRLGSMLIFVCLALWCFLIYLVHVLVRLRFKGAWSGIENHFMCVCVCVCACERREIY